MKLNVIMFEAGIYLITSQFGLEVMSQTGVQSLLNYSIIGLNTKVLFHSGEDLEFNFGTTQSNFCVKVKTEDLERQFEMMA